MKTVDVFRRIDCIDNCSFVDLFWQRQLDENSVDVFSPIQISD